MRQYLIILSLLIPAIGFAQFTPESNSNFTIIMTDGTYESQHSPQRPPGDAKYKDPIRSMGMVDAIQAGAFTVRPKFGKIGYLLVFCVNDSVGGKQGTLDLDGNVYYGIYRLIRQKIALDEEIPEGMTSYRMKGTVFFLGIS